jgi:hypothetical protein
MSVSRAAVGGTARRGRKQNHSRRHRLGLLLFLSLAVGGAAGIFAFGIIWMPTLFGVFHANSTQRQIQASMIFPSPAAIHNTLNVDDPPVYTAPYTPHGGSGGDDGGSGGGDD